VLLRKPVRNHNVLNVTRNEVEGRQAGSRKLNDCALRRPRRGEVWKNVQSTRRFRAGTFRGLRKVTAGEICKNGDCSYYC
jgi:hypothetical protein